TVRIHLPTVSQPGVEIGVTPGRSRVVANLVHLDERRLEVPVTERHGDVQIRVLYPAVRHPEQLPFPNRLTEHEMDMIVDVDDVIGSPFLPPDGIARLPHGDAAPPHRRNADFTPIGPEHAPLTTLPGRPARALKAR